MGPAKPVGPIMAEPFGNTAPEAFSVFCTALTDPATEMLLSMVVSPSTSMAMCLAHAMKAEPIVVAPFGNTVREAFSVFCAALQTPQTDTVPTLVSPSTVVAICMELATMAEPIVVAPFGNTVREAFSVFCAASLPHPTVQILTRASRSTPAETSMELAQAAAVRVIARYGNTARLRP